MNNNSLSNKLSKLAEQINDSENLYVDVLANKVAKHFKENPADATLGQFNIILKKMASTRDTISKSEFKSLYNKLYTSNSNFSTIFEKELGSKSEVLTPKFAKKDNIKVENTFADPLLTNIFASIYENKEFKLYSDKLAKQANEDISNILESFNLVPKELNIEEGNQDVLIAKASYETPKGYSYIYIPIAIKDNKVKEASVFVGTNGINDLTKENIRSYLIGSVGVKFNVTAMDIFKMLVKTASTNEKINSVDLAFASLNNNKREQLGLTGNTVLGIKVAEVVDNSINKPFLDETLSFSQKVGDVKYAAHFKFGSKLNTGMELVARKLKEFGYNSPQISVYSYSNDDVLYSVAVGGTAFSIPVKMATNMKMPEVMICNGMLNELTSEAISALKDKNIFDSKAASSASPQHGLSNAELVNSIIDSVGEGNLDKAEDALNVIANTGDRSAYLAAFDTYKKALANVKEVEACKCDLLIKNAKNSKHPICGHLGLPINKVYTDKHGNCRPNYRRNQSDTFEVGSYMTAKILGF